MECTDRVILITGASRGLGAAVARLAAQLGARVALAARSLEPLQQQAELIRAAGGEALALPADLSSEADCRAVVDETLAHFGRLDALINNSGAVEPIGPVAEANLEAWRQNWALNLLAPVLLTRLALPALREQHGRVINITSGAVESAIAGWGAYSTAKAALNQLTRVLAAEEPEITAIAVRPGLVDTQMQATIREKGAGRMAHRNYAWLAGLHEQGKLLSPETPGRAIACLACQAPREWSGEIIQWDEARVQELVRQRWPQV